MGMRYGILPRALQRTLESSQHVMHAGYQRDKGFERTMSRRKIRIPRTFRIGSQLYHVNYDASLEEEELSGECDRDTNQVRLNPLDSETKQEDTFLHEVIECIAILRDMELDHWKIQLLANDLHQALTTARGRASHLPDKSSPPESE